MKILFLVMLAAVSAFADEVDATTTTTTWAGVAASFLALVGLGVKQFLDHRGDSKVRDVYAEHEAKIDKLFQYNDRRNEQINDINKTIALIDNHSRDIAELVSDIKDMTKTIAEVQRDIARLVAMQELLLSERRARKE